MSRRIVLTVLALIGALLGITTVPLGLITAGQDRDDFRDATITAATTLANVAEERLADRTGGLALTSSIGELARRGDQAAVDDQAGARIAGTAAVPAVPARQVRRVLSGPAPAVVQGTDRLIIIAPVIRDGGKSAIGAVVLSRSSEVLDHRLAMLWTWLASVAIAGLLAAVLVATALARWVSRPLAALDTAAGRLGDGDLQARADAGQGPAEVRSLGANFNAMAARLQALVHGHQAMLADVSHQLRTPLAALRLRLDVLAQDGDAGLAEELAGAQDEIARLGRMVNGLLAAARAENVPAQPVPVAVDTVIEDRVAAWRPAAEERQITLAAGLDPAIARLNEGHLEQIMDNLLANALEAVQPGGLVRVSTSASPAGVRIVVADDGPGMSGQQQRAAFRRFAGTTKGGTGLGLAIVYRLVTSNGGSAALSDTPGGGLTVTMTLPPVARDHGQRRPGTAVER